MSNPAHFDGYSHSTERECRVSALSATGNRDEVHPVDLYLAELTTPVSRRTSLSAANCVARVAGMPDAFQLDWASLSLPELLSLRARLQERYAPASVNRMLSVTRSILRACWQLDLIDAERYQRVQAVKYVPGTRLPPGRMLNADECAALFQACAQDSGPMGPRDAAALALMLGCGLRRAEAVALHTSAIDFRNRVLRVVGKGDRERYIPCTPQVMSAFEDWFAIRTLEPGPFLVQCGRLRRVWVHKLIPMAASGQGLAEALRRRCRQAGIPHATPHDLRRTFVSTLLEADVDLLTVGQLVGHVSPATTARYDRRGMDRMHEAVDRLDLPYKPRFATPKAGPRKPRQHV